MRRNALKAVVKRNGAVVWEGKLTDLKVVKQQVDQVGQGGECGVMFEGFDGFEVGDAVEVYERVERAAKAETTALGGVKLQE